jgi:hypothetical protein
MERPEKREPKLIQFKLGEDICDLVSKECQVKQIDTSEYIRGLIIDDLEAKGHLASRRRPLLSP